MNTYKLTLEISGITCNHCVNKISKVLELNGVISKDISLEQGNATLIFDADIISKSNLISAINDTEIYKVISEKIDKL